MSLALRPLRPNLPPAVDEGDPPGGLVQMWRKLAPTPGRLGNTLRIVGLVLASVTISEVFRMPDAALSAYIVLFVSKGEATSTIAGAAVVGIAVALAVFVTIAVFMLSLSEPALRIPLIALMTFVATFLSRISPLGPVFFAAGFIMAYGLTLGDSVLQLSLAPEFAANVSGGFVLPEAAFIPPEEALVRFLLWLAAAVGMPVALVIAANLATGRDPAVVWRAAMTARLAAAGRFCAGEPGGHAALARLAGEGVAELAKLAKLAGQHRDPRRSQAMAALTTMVSRLCVVLLAWARLSAPTADLAPVARICRETEGAIRGGRPASIDPTLVLDHASGAARPLARELVRTLQAITRIVGGETAAAGENAQSAKPALAAPPHHLTVPDAFSNPGYARFAFKVTLAVMLCYAGESLANWPGIHTCIITCFFVSLDTVGETNHKAALRVIGCLIGGGLGLGTILLLMPGMTDIGDLLLAIGAVTLLAGWVATGSERISYAGWQIAIAYYLAVLQGFGPTLDMETARDRLIGILIGDVVVLVIFTGIWPVKVADAVRRNLATALDGLAGLMAPAALTAPGSAPATLAYPAAAFVQSIAQAGALLVNDPYEAPAAHHARPVPIDAGLLLDMQALAVPVSVIVELGTHQDAGTMDAAPLAAVLAYHGAMSGWLHAAAAWMRSGVGADTVIAALPTPPSAAELSVGSPDAREHGAERAAWYATLDQDLRAILDKIGPRVASQVHDHERVLAPA